MTSLSGSGIWDFPLVITISVSVISSALLLLSLLRSSLVKRRIIALERKTPQKTTSRNASLGFWPRLLGKHRSDVELALLEVEAQKRQRSRNQKVTPLILRLQQAGLSWRTSQYYLLCSLVGITIYISFTILAGTTNIAGIALSVSTAVAIPHAWLKHRVKRRLKSFDQEFPKALGLIVRGLKAGLPLVDCLRIVSKDTRNPVKKEFQSVIDEQALGMPLPDAIIRLSERIPLPDVNFLAIVVVIQSKTGGSLAEALLNLSETLAERRKLQGKIRAMSQEAKSSATIIGSLPLLVALTLHFLNPEYLAILYTNTTGIVILIMSALWMGLGILTMRKMISFEV